MSWTDILTTQLTDPFRIGLMVALFWTTLRLRSDTGFLMPLVAGILFFAVMLPTTLPITGADYTMQILTGALAHLIIVAILVAGWMLLKRFRG